MLTSSDVFNQDPVLFEDTNVKRFKWFCDSTSSCGELEDNVAA